MAQAARALIGIGVFMLVLTLLARLAQLSPANLVGDDLAIVVSLGVIATGAVYLGVKRS